MKYLITTLVLMASINSASALNQLKKYDPEPFTEVKLLEWHDSTRLPRLSLIERNRAWLSYIEGAKSTPLSSGGLEQNYAHFCEKKSGTCTDGIFYRSKTGPMLLVEITDLNDKIIMRLACHFPRKQMDIRICADVDRGGQTKSIQNSDGKWEVVMRQAAN